MIENLLSLFRNAGLPIANHLWQSTIFVAAVALLTRLFNKNRAHIRYRLWLAASIKFLIPFAVLIALGGAIPIANHAAPVLQPSLMSAVHTAEQPFSASSVAQNVSTPSLMQRVEAWLPAALVLIWLIGFAVVLLAWYARWRQVSKMLQNSLPVESGREVEILRRVEDRVKFRTKAQFLISSDLMEPGVFGVLRPTLLWPAQLSDRLDDAHLEAILVHEVTHVQRRDNLAALLHMAVEAVFWFHPFVWWIERRMIEERERACDEAVVGFGSPADVYADSLLKVSRFCAEPPLPCVSGITGADLSKRIRAIMTHRIADLTLGKRLILAVLALCVVAGPVAFGLLQTAPVIGQILHSTGQLPSFDVASVRPSPANAPYDGIQFDPSGIIVRNIPLKTVVMWAFNVANDSQISGLPRWTRSERFEIWAKVDSAKASELSKLPRDRVRREMQLRMQSLLEHRFGLRVGFATKELPVYELTVAKGGLKCPKAAPPARLRQLGAPPSAPGFLPPPPPPPPPPAPGSAAFKRRDTGGFHSSSAPMWVLASMLSFEPELDGRIVEDKTGVKGTYRIDLAWSRPGAEDSGPSLFTALQQQLGLKLVPIKGPVETLVVQSVEKPSSN